MFEQIAAAVPHPFLPLWAAWLIVMALAAGVTALLVWWRRSALRAWQAYAAHFGGEFAARNQFAPRCVIGRAHDRDFILETAVSHEDDAPYFHTRLRFPVKNPSGLVLGLRRKSLLEEAQTRRDTPNWDLGDPAFSRQFFLIANERENVAEVLTPDARAELARYHDIEIYLRFEEIEWRRSGAQTDLKAMLRLTQMLARMADAIDALPPRNRTLTQRLADEALISKGV